jgi:geranylgeranyl diphosphate synthase, type II
MHSLPELQERLARFAAAHPFPAEPAELYIPCEYMMSLGGKRLRPALALLAAELFSDLPDDALPVAWAVEIFHNFTLMHDDIMDAAPLRRGKTTVHTKWNVNTGILSGDVMLIFAYQLLAAVPNPALALDLIRIFNRVATGVCEGQQLDMNFETRPDVSLPEYLRMIELKTAVLLGGAMEMGALCAGADRATADHLYEFGRLAGVAFQIQDDLLDTYGDPAKFGKQVGGDILQNKKTYLVLKTFEIAPPEDRAALYQWMQTTTVADPAEKVAAVRSIFDRNGAPALVEAEKGRFEEAAFAHLDAVGVPEARKTMLRSMVADLFVRTF